MPRANVFLELEKVLGSNCIGRHDGDEGDDGNVGTSAVCGINAMEGEAQRSTNNNLFAKCARPIPECSPRREHDFSPCRVGFDSNKMMILGVHTCLKLGNSQWDRRRALATMWPGCSSAFP